MGETGVLTGKIGPGGQWFVRSHVLELLAGPVPLLWGVVSACAQLGLGRHYAFYTLLITGNLTAEANESHSWGLGCFCQFQQWRKSSWLLCSGAGEKVHRRELVPQVKNNHRKFDPGATFKNKM